MNKQADIRNEEILLLGLCRLSVNVELKIMLQALAEEITDWPYFCNLANQHGIEALVYHNLTTLGFIGILPDREAEKLRIALMQNLRRNTIIGVELAETLKILNENNINAVLLKGMALELSVYGNEGLRQMSDVDVLVERKDSIRAWQLLKGNGFRALPLKSVFHRIIIADAGKHLPTLVRGDLHFEIHQELFGGTGNKLTKLMADTSKMISVNGQQAAIPSPQLFFLYLLRHLYLHEMKNESQLRLYADLVILIEKYREEIINPRLLSLAFEAGMNDLLAAKLEPLRDLMGIAFPDWLNEFINRNYAPSSVNRFIFFLKSPKNNPPENNARIYRNTINDIPGFHRKVLYVVGDLFPSIRFMKLRYNCRYGIYALFYYPHRWGKLLYLLKS